MAIAAVAGLLSLAGTGMQVFGQMEQAKAAEKAEKFRHNQMNLEAVRAKREQIRRAQVGRAEATANAVTQGAQFTSALEGGKAQITQEANRNLVAIEQDRRIGGLIFKANKDYYKAGQMVALGGGVSALGGAVSGMSGTLQRLSY